MLFLYPDHFNDLKKFLFWSAQHNFKKLDGLTWKASEYTKDLVLNLFQHLKTGDDDENDVDNQGLTRAPIGQLGDFISLAGYSSEDEELHTDHRLI